MSEENVEIVRAAIEAFNQRAWDSWESRSHADVEIDWSASRGLEAAVYRGREETDRFVRTFETFESVQIDVDRYIEAGDLVIVSNTTTFVGRDGIETVAHSAVTYEVRDGLISRVRLYQETAEALEAAGLSE